MTKMMCDWLKFMFTFPRVKPLIKTQKFTLWSSLIAYLAGGFTFLAGPQLYKIIFNIEFQGRTEGYLRLISLGSFIIGFLIIIMARSKDQGPILGTIFGRLVIVNAALLMLALRDMIPLSFALAFMALDFSLALITLVIWCRETEEASVFVFFQTLFVPLFTFRGLRSGVSIAAVYLVGLSTMLFWFIFTITPQTAVAIFKLDKSRGQTDGFLACAFFTFGLHCWFHVTNSSFVNYAFIPAAIFYRVVLSMPAIVILYLVDQIERNLFLLLLSFEVGFSIILFLFAVLPQKCVSPSRSEEPDEMTMLRNE